VLPLHWTGGADNDTARQKHTDWSYYLFPAIAQQLDNHISRALYAKLQRHCVTQLQGKNRIIYDQLHVTSIQTAPMSITSTDIYYKNVYRFASTMPNDRLDKNQRQNASGTIQLQPERQLTLSWCWPFANFQAKSQVNIISKLRHVLYSYIHLFAQIQVFSSRHWYISVAVLCQLLVAVIFGSLALSVPRYFEYHLAHRTVNGTQVLQVSK